MCYTLYVCEFNLSTPHARVASILIDPRNRCIMRIFAGSEFVSRSRVPHSTLVLADAICTKCTPQKKTTTTTTGNRQTGPETCPVPMRLLRDNPCNTLKNWDDTPTDKHIHTASICIFNRRQTFLSVRFPGPITLFTHRRIAVSSDPE